MSRLFAIAVIAAAITLTSVPFLSALGPVAARVNLTCILVVALVTNLRPRDAVVAATASGLVADLLAATPPLVHVVLWIAVAGIVVVLGDRVFSHLSIGALIGLNAIAYLLYETGSGIYAMIAARIAGLPSAAGFLPDGALVLVYGLVAQLAVALALTLLFRRLRAMASPFIMIRPSS